MGQDSFLPLKNSKVIRDRPTFTCRFLRGQPLKLPNFAIIVSTVSGRYSALNFVCLRYNCESEGGKTVQYRNCSRTTNDPMTETDPQTGQQLIVDRKRSREQNQNGLDLSYWIIVSRLLSQQNVLLKLHKFNK